MLFGYVRFVNILRSLELTVALSRLFRMRFRLLRGFLRLRYLPSHPSVIVLYHHLVGPRRREDVFPLVPVLVYLFGIDAEVVS
jgi:hypothetical protein